VKSGSKQGSIRNHKSTHVVIYYYRKSAELIPWQRGLLNANSALEGLDKKLSQKFRQCKYIFYINAIKIYSGFLRAILEYISGITSNFVHFLGFLCVVFTETWSLQTVKIHVTVFFYIVPF
jgi:hypothetical protein